MRIQRILTNETCNQNCGFCNARRPAETPSLVAKSAVHQRIAAARATSPREIVLTGGEPTLRRDLEDLVQRAKAPGVRVALETNAALIDVARAQRLAQAGLDLARVQLVAWGSDADEITRDPGGFEATLRAIRALAAAGVSVEVTTALVTANLHLLADLPRQILAAQLPVEALVLIVPVQAPDRAACAPLHDAARTIAAVADAARSAGLSLRLDPQTFVPPCLFERPERVAHLFALNRGNAARAEHERVPQCADCLVNDRCPGLPHAARQGEAQAVLHPILAQRLRRRLTVASSVPEQIARELLTIDEARGEDAWVREHTVRVNFHCNQACEFCFVSTHLPSASEEAIRAAIEDAARAAAVVVLSGGEPTLNPRLLSYVRLAREAGARAVEIQTNATRLGDGALVRELVQAGVDRAMVSLHGSTAAISDRVTGAPGTFAATVLGIDALAATTVALRLNFVICQANCADFPDYVQLVAARWPGVPIVFSFVGSHTDVVPRSTALIPRFVDVLPFLLEGLQIARDAGVEVIGFDSMCGLPLCFVPAKERDAFSHSALAADAGDGEFVKDAACAACSENHRCYGVRRGYADLYGTSEVRPVAAPTAG